LKVRARKKMFAKCLQTCSKLSPVVSGTRKIATNIASTAIHPYLRQYYITAEHTEMQTITYTEKAPANPREVLSGRNVRATKKA
jgi:hypothetical protein